MALADALGSMWRLFSLFSSLFPLSMSLLDPHPTQGSRRVGIEGVGSESQKVIPFEKAKHAAAVADTPSSLLQ